MNFNILKIKNNLQHNLPALLIFVAQASIFQSCNYAKSNQITIENRNRFAVAHSISKYPINLEKDIDWVCGMSVKEFCSDTTIYENKIYNFCCHG